MESTSLTLQPPQPEFKEVGITSLTIAVQKPKRYLSLESQFSIQ